MSPFSSNCFYQLDSSLRLVLWTPELAQLPKKLFGTQIFFSVQLMRNIFFHFFIYYRFLKETRFDKKNFPLNFLSYSSTLYGSSRLGEKLQKLLRLFISYLSRGGLFMQNYKVIEHNKLLGWKKNTKREDLKIISLFIKMP